MNANPKFLSADAHVDEAAVAIAITGSGDKERVRCAFDCALDGSAPNRVKFSSPLLALGGIGATTSLGNPSLELLRLISPAHVHDSHIAGAEVVGHLLEVSAKMVGPFGRESKRQLGQRIIKPGDYQVRGGVATHRDSGAVRSVHTKSQPFIQLEKLMDLLRG